MMTTPRRTICRENKSPRFYFTFVCHPEEISHNGDKPVAFRCLKVSVCRFEISTVVFRDLSCLLEIYVWNFPTRQNRRRLDPPAYHDSNIGRYDVIIFSAPDGPACACDSNKQNSRLLREVQIINARTRLATIRNERCTRFLLLGNRHFK